ncbi:hypothetical protein NQZ79_g1726 [Umbelopsis isabellina]|nr:hypothetical protein NQZ79_g1726 [Umbelopsis isabellina]
MFTPVQSLFGGGLLFVAVTGLAAYNGKVAGISGIINNTFYGDSAPWRRAFLAGMGAMGLMLRIFPQMSGGHSVPPFPFSIGRAIAAGLFVGVGTKLGSGCTSGHMLCGIARLSKRSIVASATFFATGAATVYFTGGVPPRYNTVYPSKDELAKLVFYIIAAASTFELLPAMIKKKTKDSTSQSIVGFLTGLTFALGLFLSGMTNTEKVRGFLDLTRPQNWDPSLLMVVAGGLVPNIIAYQFFLKKKEKPTFNSRFDWPTKKDLDARLLLGSALFGIGWGLCGVCPGPGLVTLAANPSAGIFAFWMSYLVGSGAAGYV